MFSIRNDIVQPTVVVLVLASSVAICGIAEASTQCKSSYVTAKSDARFKSSATVKAALAWSVYVSTHFGSSWSSWSIASHKSISCKRHNTFVSCTAKAKPCKFSGGSGGLDAADVFSDTIGPIYRGDATDTTDTTGDTALPDSAAPDDVQPVKP